MKKLLLFFAVVACAATLFSSCTKKGADEDKNPYDQYAVDLGLSVKWASVNVGATKEKDFGKYYGWGEISDKADDVYYDWDSYEVFKGIGTDDASRNAALSALYDDKLILKYARFVRKKKKKDDDFKGKMNYSDQMDYLLPYSESTRERMKDILERAGFSRNEITESEFNFADSTVEELKKASKKSK